MTPTCSRPGSPTIETDHPPQDSVALPFPALRGQNWEEGPEPAFPGDYWDTVAGAFIPFLSSLGKFFTVSKHQVPICPEHQPGPLSTSHSMMRTCPHMCLPKCKKHAPCILYPQHQALPQQRKGSVSAELLILEKKKLLLFGNHLEELQENHSVKCCALVTKGNTNHPLIGRSWNVYSKPAPRK